MQKWSLQDIRPTGQSRSGVRGQIHTRPAPRHRTHAVNQDVDNKKVHDTFHDNDDDFTIEENISADDVSSVHDTYPRAQMSDVRSRRQNTDDYGAELSSSGYGKTMPLPRALRGQGIPINPTPVRLYIRIATFLLAGSAIIGFFIMNAYSRATVTIALKAAPVTVDAIMSASIDGEGLKFSTIDHTLEAEVKIAADGLEDVSELASGYLTIYNTFSDSIYSLIKNTRFETPDKKIFRIQESVKIPGYTKEDGAIVPGSVVARVFADKPGEGGNIAPTQFTIPGFSGSPEFEKIYAESTDAFTGGIIGQQSIVSDDSKVAAVAEAHAALAEKLRKYAVDQRPAGQVLYVDAVRITYTEMPPVPTEDDSIAKIIIRAKLSVPIFSLEDISREIAKSSIIGYAGEAYLVQNPSTLTFLYAGSATSTDANAYGNIAFSLSGDAVMVRQVNKEALQEELVGIHKKDIMDIVAKYPMIERISYDLSPAWRQSFPDDVTRITFDITTPE